MISHQICTYTKLVEHIHGSTKYALLNLTQAFQMHTNDGLYVKIVVKYFHQ